jgi:hypothetical protein
MIVARCLPLRRSGVVNVLKNSFKMGVTTSRKFSSSDSYDQGVIKDAKNRSFAGSNTFSRDGLLNKLQSEFQGERISSTKRAEERLRHEIQSLVDLKVQISSSVVSVKQDKIAELREMFDHKRKQAIKLRNELVIQREVSGFGTNVVRQVEKDFQIPSLQ